MRLVKKELIIIALCFTIIVVAWNIYLAVAPLPDPKWIHYKAAIISKPKDYWILSETDPYIALALQDPGTFYYAPRNQTTFYDQALTLGWKIEYADTYYEIECLGSNNMELPKYTTIHIKEHVGSATILVGLWLTLGVMWKKKR